ncbi:uncharacterized protein LOC112898590 isoform X3 [Panicum hallii]|uniref:uncharacterized protein LOC112898590 isoform X2 n=1 Tax=Panicum hallii TaxID=206008 RepID=UPI000DF4DED5|nr:uncharacterized protein LOC112898590 isoform X2 [Panicum hallii]XP_025822722.1 uncharacterized protein LOC112898590 isoform X3 [Panicum hallii]
MAPWSPRPLLALLLLLVLLCSHIALCASAEPGKPKAKPKATGGRKALLAASSAGDDGEDAPAAKPAKSAPAAKIKKKLAGDAKNQTNVAKAKKSESAAAAKGAAKKAAGKAAAGGDASIAKVPKADKAKVPKPDKAAAGGDASIAKVPQADKAKVPKPDKAAAAKAKGADSAKPAKVKGDDSAKPVKVKGDDSAKPAKAAKPGKTAKSEAAVGKAKKPANSTADAGAKPAKSGKKAPVVADAKANATAVSKEEEAAAAGAEVEEDVVFAEEAEGTGDLISEFRGLPARLQETLMPDLARLSHHSKAYLSAANAGIADGVRPILGGRWAAAAASAASVLVLLLPLFMLTALVRRMGPYLPLLHRALLLAQAYLAIYFATLALAAAATGLEPLRFFHAASPAAYAWTQAAQSLGFMAYLVLQMVDLVAVFSGAASPEEDGGGDATKALGLAQMVVGLAVGLHYYAAVFHRAAAGEAPRANWRVYAVYAACFVVVCACARAERRKKAYLAGTDGAAEEWKKS